MNDDVFDRIAQAKDELAQPSFAARAGTVSATSRRLAAERELGGDLYDAHLAHSTKTRHHDSRSYNEKAATVTQGQGGDGGGGTPPPWWPPGFPWRGSGSGGGNGGGGGSGGGGGNGGGGNGPPSWFKRWQQKQQHGGRGRGGGGGGGRLAGPGAIGKIPQLGKVPIGAGASAPATSPIPIVIILGGVAIGGYFLWHKLRLAKHQDAQLDQGKKPDADAAA